MDVVVVEADGAPMCLVLTGRLDAAATELVETSVMAHVRRAPGHVLMDMAGVSFVGSLGIRLLISAARTADRAGRRVAIFGVQPAVAEVFRTIALDDLIPVLPDQAAALAQIRT
ncbi:STAS domain-containing protein [Roseomonas terrae]|jgi:anti-anti-sigma factor|uniref:Anti-sigma factor antagonist n=1 Tax=Neoroseomonas terrae TaxID=424799 RepID=A0ABS5EIA4_9PROT|nr:STAS domain-containing protein [Neoroseomonas terrae]MBR0650755.1 STAS domain-containing protein [Neoroseomonas terrae]